MKLRVVYLLQGKKQDKSGPRFGKNQCVVLRRRKSPAPPMRRTINAIPPPVVKGGSGEMLLNFPDASGVLVFLSELQQGLAAVGKEEKSRLLRRRSGQGAVVLLEDLLVDRELLETLFEVLDGLGILRVLWGEPCSHFKQGVQDRSPVF